MLSCRPVPAADLRRRDAPLRDGQARLRFGLEIEDATELTRSSQFKVFADASAVRYLTVPQEYSRADLERLEEFAKEWGAKGLAYIVYGEDGEARSPIAKFLSEEELGAFRAEPGSTVLFGAAEPDQVARVLGASGRASDRRAGARRRGVVAPVWVTDFPMFDWVGGGQRLGGGASPVHRPAPGSEPMLEKDPGRALAVAYDFVANGKELGGGSLRIHGPSSRKSLRHPATSRPRSRSARFGFLLDALNNGRSAPRRHRLRHRPDW